MSDAAITTIVTGVITIATIVGTWITMWLKLRYGLERGEEIARKAVEVEHKVDQNTQITSIAKDAAFKAAEHAEDCDNRWKELDSTWEKVNFALQDHQSRILALEGKFAALQTQVESVGKNIDSTRHEMRGHLQTIGTKLDIIGMTKTGAPEVKP